MKDSQEVVAAFFQLIINRVRLILFDPNGTVGSAIVDGHQDREVDDEDQHEDAGLLPEELQVEAEIHSHEADQSLFIKDSHLLLPGEF